MQDCRLDARDLACRRGDRLLFEGLSLALGPGEALRIEGPNGIGKSSLIRILAGLLPSFEGRVERVGGVGLIDERPVLDPQLPLARALSFWRRIDGAGDDQLARLGLAGLADVPVRYLSTGQRMRAAFARLLGQRAPVWLLDEPLNGLDDAAARLVETLAAEHCAAGGLCVVASHQPFALNGMRTITLTAFSPPASGRGREWVCAAGEEDEHPSPAREREGLR
ncbi:MAG: heme ABC exporter ATP-binding protein CcmA [Novosphingobium sp.]